MGLALGQQIVAAASFDGPPNELANRRELGQKYTGIDIRSIAFAPGNVRLINKQFQFTANFLPSQIMGNGLLHRHRRSITRILCPSWNLRRHPGRAGTLFLGVFEYSKAFKATAMNKVQQCLEFRICFAWEPDDKRSAQGYARNSIAQFVN